MGPHLIDEIMFCTRCGKGIECIIDAYSRCACGKIQLNPDEVKHVSKSYNGCLCNECLMELKEEYTSTLS
jgi:hypothetical protein